VSVGRIRAELAVALERERVGADRRADIAVFISGACSNVVVDAYVLAGRDRCMGRRRRPIET
jgi:anti-sigma regulatory factor (Ser/Thr protein kinase)